MSRRTLSIVVAAVVVLGAVGAGGRWLLREEHEVTTRSDEAYRSFEEGRVHYRLFRQPEALESFQKAVQTDPDFAMAFLEMASVYYVLNQHEKAREQLQRAFDLRGKVSELERLQIEQRYAQAVTRDFAAADSLTNLMIDRYPDELISLRHRVAKAQRAQDNENAIEIYREILARDPGSVDIHNQMGYLLLYSGHYDEAVESFKRYVYYAADQANPHDSLGEAYYHTGRYEEAIGEYLKALEIDPAFVWSASHLVDVLVLTGQFTRAHDVLERTRPVYEERNALDNFHVKEWSILNAGEKWDELLAQTDETMPVQLAEDRSNLDYVLNVLFLRAEAFLEKKDFEQADYHAVKALKTLGLVYEEIPRTPLLEDNERLVRAVVKCRGYRALEKPGLGIEALREAIGRSPRSPHLLVDYVNELVEAYYANGQYLEAARTAESMLAEIPTYPPLNLLAAKAETMLDEKARALGYLRTYMEVMRFADADHPKAPEVQALLKKLVATS